MSLPANRQLMRTDFLLFFRIVFLCLGLTFVLEKALIYKGFLHIGLHPKTGLERYS